MNRKDLAKVTKIAFQKWQKNNASIRAAALAFFTIMPLPSLLLILLEVFALIDGPSQALNQLILQINNLAGPTIANIVKELIGSEANPLTLNFGSVVIVLFALIGAVGIFTVLQDSLNRIWEIVPQRHLTLRLRLRQRIGPFFAVTLAALLVVAWTGVTNVLFISISYLLGTHASLVLGIIQIFLSFILATVLFGIIFYLLPDTRISLDDVLLAAVITSILSTATNYIFGVYIHAFPATSLGGPAGAIILLMLWIFLIDEFILFGAQFSRTYAEIIGSRLRIRQQMEEIHKLSKPDEKPKTEDQKEPKKNVSES